VIPPIDVSDGTYGAKPEGRFLNGARVLVVVHTNGIHHIPCHFCACDGHPNEDVQLIRMGFYPASHKEVRTVFTFALLDQHLLENLECYTSSMHFYSKLRRLTNEIFPKKTPVHSSSLLASFSTEINMYRTDIEKGYDVVASGDG
jgi:CxC2 like cysteine cluster associated with KDZ transposases